MSASISPRAAVAWGIVMALCGVPAILGGLGLIPLTTPELPGWVMVALGLIFALGGAGLIVGYTVGGDSALQYVLGVGVLGSMMVVFGWTAFGPGRRNFSTILAVPFLSGRSGENEVVGRAVYGAGTILMGAFLMALTSRRLRTRKRRRRK